MPSMGPFKARRPSAIRNKSSKPKNSSKSTSSTSRRYRITPDIIRKIHALMEEGHTVEQISKLVGISLYTVRTHVKIIKELKINGMNVDRAIPFLGGNISRAKVEYVKNALERKI